MKGMLLLDIGGTYIKFGRSDAQGELIPDSVDQFPARAEESVEAVFSTLRDIIRLTGGTSASDAACVSTAGPFDFDQGVSLMRHKFSPLYGKSLRPPFEDAGLPVSFLHDSTAFLLGEYGGGLLADAQVPCCVMLGTGLGFACMRDGRVLVDDNQTPVFKLWNSPYRDGVAEDYVSTRAIQRVYGHLVPVKEIALRARQGDQAALSAFRTAGEHLSRILTPLLTCLGCDRFALGGQIARSADLLAMSLPVAWGVSAHLDDVALRGACRYALLGRKACVQVCAPQNILSF